MRTNETIYLSDFFTVPMPKKAASHRDYLRKIKNRRILWGLLPYIVQAIGVIAAAGFTMVGLTMLLFGLGG